MEKCARKHYYHPNTPWLFILVEPCLENDDSWKDWAGESCQYYANRPLECGEYDKFSHEYPGFLATNPCCACKGGIDFLNQTIEVWAINIEISELLQYVI